MFYKHWNKIALALTGFFWASCDTDTTSANNVDEPAPNSSAAPLSSALVNGVDEATTADFCG